jgi:hypothetical protein
MPLLLGRRVSPGAQACERREIVYPQTHVHPMFGDQLSGQTKGHAHIAEVIHNGTENIPRGFHPGSLRMFKKADCPS